MTLPKIINFSQDFEMIKIFDRNFFFENWNSIHRHNSFVEWNKARRTLGIVKEHKWQFLIFSFIIWSHIVLVIREDFYAKILTITKLFHVRNVVHAFILIEFCTLSNMSFIKYIKYFAKHVCICVCWNTYLLCNKIQTTYSTNNPRMLNSHELQFVQIICHFLCFNL